MVTGRVGQSCAKAENGRSEDNMRKNACILTTLSSRSFPRKRESRFSYYWLWVPASAGTSGTMLIPDHHQPVGARLRTPGLAGAAQHLTYRRATFVRRKAFELLGRRIETQDRVCDEVRHPNLVLIIDIDRVAAAPAVRQREGLPCFRRRIIAAELAGVPEAHPQHAL